MSHPCGCPKFSRLLAGSCSSLSIHSAQDTVCVCVCVCVCIDMALLLRWACVISRASHRRRPGVTISDVLPVEDDADSPFIFSRHPIFKTCLAFSPSVLLRSTYLQKSVKMDFQYAHLSHVILLAGLWQVARCADFDGINATSPSAVYLLL